LRILEAIQTFIDLAESEAASEGRLGRADDAARIARKLTKVAVMLADAGLLPFGDDDESWVETAFDAGWLPPEMVEEFLERVDNPVCDDPDCECHGDDAAVCEDCGADLSPSEDDVVATLVIGDHGVRVGIDGLCEEHGDRLASALFAVADAYVSDDDDDDDFLVDEA
jgi:hypothetical protein